MRLTPQCLPGALTRGAAQTPGRRAASPWSPSAARMAALFSLILATVPSFAAAQEGGAVPDAPLTVVLEPVFQVGGMDGPEWSEFGRVAAVSFDGDGYLYVLDQQTATVTVVAPDGTLHGTVGRRGQGPGELARPFSMTATPGGRVVVSDFGHRGLAVFHRNGEWIRNVPLDPGSVGLPAGRLSALDDHWVTSADFLVLGGDRSLPTGRRDDTRPVWALPLDAGREPVRLASAWRAPAPDGPGGSAGLTVRRDNGAVSLSSGREDVFAPPLRVAADGRGRVAVVDSSAYEIRWFSPDPADARSPAVRDIPPIPVTRQVRELELDRRRARILAEAENPSSASALTGKTPQALARDMLEGLEELTFYGEVPSIRTLLGGPSGQLWVERWPADLDGVGPVDIFDRDGSYRGTWRPPGGLPAALGPCGLAAYLERDALDVALVRVVRMSGVGSPCPGR